MEIWMVFVDERENLFEGGGASIAFVIDL